MVKSQAISRHGGGRGDVGKLLMFSNCHFSAGTRCCVSNNPFSRKNTHTTHTTGNYIKKHKRFPVIIQMYANSYRDRWDRKPLYSITATLENKLLYLLHRTWFHFPQMQNFNNPLSAKRSLVWSDEVTRERAAWLSLISVCGVWPLDLLISK